MNRYSPYLRILEERQSLMEQLVINWSNINSYSRNLVGIETMCESVASAFASLQGQAHAIDPPPGVEKESVGKMLRIVKRESAPLRVFLCIHLDTVFPSTHPFQKAEVCADRRIRGPGVADAKGGLVVMLHALEALESSPFREGIGWEVLINSDEEIGSPLSSKFFKEAAQRNHLGLLFEPALPDGSLAKERLGTGNFEARVHGRSAHVGRNFHAGKNAIVTASEIIQRLHALNDPAKGIILNIGKIEGGGPLNVVPDLASFGWNVRIRDSSQMKFLEDQFEQMKTEFSRREGIQMDWSGRLNRPPKNLTPAIECLFEQYQSCAGELDQTLSWKSTGGCCDGNNLAFEGLPNLDSLGVRGGGIHTPDEFLIPESLSEKARLTALFLMKLGAGEIAWPYSTNRVS